ncbi:MAG: cystathionine beta-lyase [Parvibaculales bacterium]
MDNKTKILHKGRMSKEHYGIINPPLYRVSTILYDSYDEFLGKKPKEYVYGRYHTPTTHALSKALCALDGGEEAYLCPSGSAAIATALSAYAETGDHILLSDSVYGPTRDFAEQYLRPKGVEVEFYDPKIGSNIEKLLRKNSSLVFVESPGSLTFEIQDVPAISHAAHSKGLVVIMDNTWGTGLHYKPFVHGVDVCIQALTKYVGGHSDLMMGAISVTRKTKAKIAQTHRLFGQCVSGDEAWLALRGLRSLAARLAMHEKNGLEIAKWLAKRKEVMEVWHPALPGFEGHKLWKRDFTGSNGLFSILLRPCTEKALAVFLDGLELFKIGYSWGGYESLILPKNPASERSAVPWQREEILLRLHVGLEDVEDLKKDLENGFSKMEKINV